MADYRYFAEHNGQTVRLVHVYHDGAVSGAAAHFKGQAPDGTVLVAERAIEYKRNPSRHKCDARCQHAKGHKCECSCDGKNHGKG